MSHWSGLTRRSERKLPTFWSAAEVAQALKVARCTVIRWAHLGLLDNVRVGKHYRFPPTAIRQLMQLRGRMRG